MAAQTVYVLFGFGSGLIAVGTMALFMPRLTDVVVLLLLVSLPSEVFVVSKSRKSITWRGVVLICVGIAGGIALGTRILTMSSPTIVLTALGCFLMVAGPAFLLLPDDVKVRWPGWTGLPLGVTSGTLAGMFGTGGPPLIFYYRLAGVSKARFRGSLMALFLVVTLVRLPAYAIAGLLTAPLLVSAAALLPASLFGVWLGNHLHVQLSEMAFRRMVSFGLFAIGALLLIR